MAVGILAERTDIELFPHHHVIPHPEGAFRGGVPVGVVAEFPAGRTAIRTTKALRAWISLILKTGSPNCSPPGRGVVQSGEDVVVIEKRLIAMGGIYVAVGILAERTDIELC